ncbi:MAG: hypothetical protein ACKOFO_11105, partial [Gemmatimonadota bacterium]
MTLRLLLALSLAGAAAACRPVAPAVTPAPAAIDAPATDTTARRVPSDRPCVIPPTDDEMRRAAWEGYRTTFTTL